MQEAPDSAQGGHIYRAAVRLPPFWSDRPGICFAQAEAQFALAFVTSEKTKFNYAISQLEYRHAAEIEDIIITPPADEPYTTLKTELVRRLSSSRDQRIRQLLTHEEIGDREPSHFLQHLKSLAPDVPDDFMRSIWSSTQHKKATGSSASCGTTSIFIGQLSTGAKATHGASPDNCLHRTDSLACSHTGLLCASPHNRLPRRTHLSTASTDHHASPDNRLPRRTHSSAASPDLSATLDNQLPRADSLAGSFT